MITLRSGWAPTGAAIALLCLLGPPAGAGVPGAGEWLLIPGAAQPPIRTNFAHAFDTQRSRLIIFGGRDVSCGGSNSVYAFDVATETWTQLTAIGVAPAPRYASLAVYDEAADRLLVYGGISDQCSGTRFNDVWALSFGPTLNFWSQLTPGGTPPPGAGYSAGVYDALRNRVYIHGGLNAQTDDFYILTLGQSPQWSTLEGTYGVALPATLFAHTMIHDCARDQIVINGDFSGGGSNRTWFLNLTGTPTWSIKLENLGSREGHSAIYDPVRDRMVVFGGRVSSGDNEAVDDVEVLDLATRTWSTLAPGGAAPAGRMYHAAAYDAIRDQMIIHGGSPAGILPPLNPQDGGILHWGATVSVPPAAGATGLRIASAYPNPARPGPISVAFEMAPGAEGWLEISDVSGRRLMSRAVPASGGVRQVESIDLSGLRRAGMYFITLRQGADRATGRFVLMD